jgi:hypothetical protein
MQGEPPDSLFRFLAGHGNPFRHGPRREPTEFKTKNPPQTRWNRRKSLPGVRAERSCARQRERPRPGRGRTSPWTNPGPGRRTPSGGRESRNEAAAPSTAFAPSPKPHQQQPNNPNERINICQQETAKSPISRPKFGRKSTTASAKANPETSSSSGSTRNPKSSRFITERFDGRPISEQNLSQWRTHGYRQWHAYHVILDELDTTSEHSEEIAATSIDCEKLLLSLTASYAEMLQRWIITPCEEMTYKLAVFKNITHAALALRRAEIQKARLELDARRLELLGEKQRNKSTSVSSEAIGRGAEPPGVGAGGKSWEEASRDSGGLGKSGASQEACHSTDKSASSTPENTSTKSAPTPTPRRPSAPKPPCSESPAPLNAKSGPQNGAPPSPSPIPASCAPSSQSAPTTQPSDDRPAAPASPPTANSQPSAVPVAPLRPSTRPSFPPRNATPRNPLGLL